MKNKVLICLFVVIYGVLSSHAVNVTLTTDEDYNNPVMIQKLQTNLAALLTEINNAYVQKRNLNLAGIPIHVPKAGEIDVKEELTTLWGITHFICDDDDVVERCWPLKDGFFVRQIPVIFDPDGEVRTESYFQEVSVAFDRNGNISEFRLGLTSGVGESLEKCNNSLEVKDVERRTLIMEFVERFKTAYNTKNISFLNKIFSDDALIITGTVIMTKPNSDSKQANAKVVYNRQNKQQYLANLRRAFARNKYIEVKFELISEHLPNVEGCAVVTRSLNDPNVYGVRLYQEWRSSNYNDDGYVFLLWDFRDENNPEIKVRTWQPTMVSPGNALKAEELFTMDDVEDWIQ